ncbi:probable histone-lysine N-methyltransferase set-23 [Phymastichus coffea]|uniref:probable histone-lysine N-methyltransferase set-23 n=1 Tax=Phymastichus coffea TaxID=108790 RepID=UPI00273B7D7D|nr:probable histone-lysine N-methyltransferase set-23 [Phymastichus coffea]
MDDYEHHPMSSSNLVYVQTNIPGPGCREDDFQEEFAVGCSCVGDDSCLEDCECTRGTANYLDGKLIATNKSIVECNSNCKCTVNCGNRVVQCGPIGCLAIRQTSKGLGLFTERSINKGQFVCEYAGEVISLDEARQRFESNRNRQLMNYVLVVTEHLGDKKITTCVDPAVFGNIGRYANHSCQPNAIIVPVRVDITVPRMCLFAKRDIKEGEEMTFDYAGDDSTSVQNSETPCLCRTERCRIYLPHCPV